MRCGLKNCLLFAPARFWYDKFARNSEDAGFKDITLVEEQRLMDEILHGPRHKPNQGKPKTETLWFIKNYLS